ncbi:MAG TPA: FIST C-terminal domain-containing protein [Burkholderiales bacterium]|jgi:small ligand-binding sensory domain FIST|nr:FIST C-terminal domain-containing protein [Burkholderiales bacterium]
MPDFRYAHASSADWREATRSCLAQLGQGPASLGFLYLTDVLADHAGDILATLKKASGIQHWVGTVGIGICATGREYLDEPALAVMAGDFETGSFRVFSGVASDADVDNVALKCGSAQANFAIVHADPQNGRLTELVTRLAGKMESGFLVGGLTSSRRQNLQIADGVIEGGLSGVSFSDGVTIATRLTQGCSPLGPKHTITGCQQNVIITLDGRPALDVFREDIGEALGRDLNRIGSHVFAGLPIAGSDTGDYLVRNLVGIDPANKLIAIGDMVQQNTSVLFCRRDAKTAQEDMTRMLESIRKGMFTKPRGGVYYSCIGRGASLFGPDSEELKLVREALGEFPLVGFFCNGEISHNRLYGYTGVLTLFM